MKDCVAAYCPYNVKRWSQTSCYCSIADDCHFYCPPNWTYTSDSTTPVRQVTYKYENYEKYLSVCRNCKWYHGHCVELSSPFSGEVVQEGETCKAFERKRF